MMIILVSVFVFMFYLVYIYFKLFLYTYWDHFKINTIEPTFPFGNIGKIFLGQYGLGDCVKHFYDSCTDKFAGIYFISAPALIIKDPDLIKHIIVKDFNSFTDRGIYTDEKKEPTSGHLFRLNGDRWKNIRNKLTPAFTSGKLKMMFSIITDVGNELILYLQKECANEVDVDDTTTRYSADIIASTIFGIETNSFRNKCNDFILMAKDLFVSESYIRIAKAAIQAFFPSLLKPFNLESVKQAQDKFISNMVEDVIRHREKHNVIRNDLMQLLIQLKNKGVIDPVDVNNPAVYDGEDTNEVRLTLNEISAQAYTFFFAGFETTSSTLSFLMYECALNLELQYELQKSIDAVLDKYNGTLTYESIFEMDYLDRVISETLRKYPILPFLNRIATEDYIIPGREDVTIKKGTRILVSVSGLHYDPNYYPDPQKFDPDRFLNEKIQERHQFCYLPFGEGPRRCIGKRMARVMIAVGAATLLKNFSVNVCERTEIPPEFNRLAYFIRTKNPIKLKFIQRSNP